MSVDGSKITAPVSISDVNTVLGAGTNDLGSLCKHTNINKWARFKPVVRKNLLGISDDYYKADTLDFGLTPKQSTSLSGLSASYNGTDNGWIYTPPTGGMNAPYRLTDFDKYDNDAEAPVNGANVKPVKIFTSDSAANKLGVALALSKYTGYNIKLNELGTLENCYLGIYATNGTMSRWITTTKTIKVAPNETCEVDMSGATAGTWTAYPFLSESKMTANQNISNIYYTIPNCEKVSITVTDTPQESINIIPASVSYDDFRWSATVRYTNGATKSGTVTGNIYWRVRPKDKSYDDALTAEDSYGELQNQTISYNSSGVGTFSLSMLNMPNSFEVGKVRLFVRLRIGQTNYDDNIIMSTEMYDGTTD